jgi:hypothetical protein
MGLEAKSYSTINSLLARMVLVRIDMRIKYKSATRPIDQWEAEEQ